MDPVTQDFIEVPPPMDAETKKWLLILHLSPLAALTTIPLAHIIGPLIVWLMKKNDLPLLDEQGKEVLNFQISLTLYFLVCFVLTFVMIGIPLAIGLGLFALVMVIKAAVAASDGRTTRFPITIRFLK